MFNKELFSEILIKIYKTYNNQRDFADATGVNRAYLSQYMNKKLDNAPTPKILLKIANASHDITTYEELMTICGYLEENIKDDLILKLKSLELDKLELQKAVTAFIEDYITLTDNHTINIYDNENTNTYFAYKIITEAYLDLRKKKICELLNIPISSYKNVTYNKVPLNIQEIAYEYSWKKIQNILENIEEKDITSSLTAEEKVLKYIRNFEKKQMAKVPIVGKIAAGQPILTEQYIEGYLPVDPNIYGLTASDDLFYLRVSGQSMNMKVKNGDYALIHKQDYAEDGDIVVAIVNGDDEATLKRYKKLNEQFVLLEPMSTDPTIEAITVDLKDTKFQIIGRAIGQFGKF